MEEITSPLRLGMRGTAVAALHSVLRQCIGRGTLVALEEHTLWQLAMGLEYDRVRVVYGDATATLVSWVQHERHLEENGEVDAAVAAALNELIRAWEYDA